MYYIYKITNDLNNQVYVGRTSRSVELRWQEHLFACDHGDPRHLYCAMRKYGKAHFKVSLVKSFNTFDEMVLNEAFYCKYYKAYTEGYNMTTAGEVNPMECRKSRISHDLKMQQPEVKAKISLAIKDIRKKEHTIAMHLGTCTRRIIYSKVSEYLKAGWVQGVSSNRQNFYDGIHIKMYENKNNSLLIAPNQLEEYIRLGWTPRNLNFHAENNTAVSEASKTKRHRMYKEDKEITVSESEVSGHLMTGWHLGGKPGRMTPEQKAKLSWSHKDVPTSFREEQSQRISKYFKNNIEARRKRSYPVQIFQKDEVFTFKSCFEAGIFLGLTHSEISSGYVGKYIKKGYISKRKSPYYKYSIKKL